MNADKAVPAKRQHYGLIYKSAELTRMLRRFNDLVNDSVAATGRKFGLFTDGRDKLEFVLKDLSPPIKRQSLAELFRGESLQYLLTKAQRYGFAFLREEKEPGFIDIASGFSFKFNIPGLNIRAERGVNFLQDTGSEANRSPTAPINGEQLVLTASR